MAQAIAIGLYFFIGSVVAVVIYRRRGGSGEAVIGLVIWPLALPALMFSGTGQVRAGGSNRIRDAALAVENAWQAVTPGDGRELDAVRAFVRRLEATAIQLEDLSKVLISAAPTVTDRLAELKSLRERELQDGLRLLDDLSAQLVVLRFSRGTQQVDSRRMEEILARIESLAQLNAQDLRAS